MTDGRSIPIDDATGDYLDEMVSSGRYASPAEAVRAAVEAMREEDRKIEALRAAIALGEKSGPPAPFDIDDFFARAAERRAKRQRRSA